MNRHLLLFAASLALHAQPMRLPRLLISGGAGFASPNGKFSYTSESTLILPQNTYTTVALEYTMLHSQVQSCTLAGISKPLYQFGRVTIGLTGLGGGCTSTSGDAAASMSGQAFLHVAFGNNGIMLSARKNNEGGVKGTIGWSWGDYTPAPATSHEQVTPPAREPVCLPEDLGCFYPTNSSMLDGPPKGCEANRSSKTGASPVAIAASAKEDGDILYPQGPQFDRTMYEYTHVSDPAYVLARIMARKAAYLESIGDER